ncbi:MAG: hypothetical protein OXN44_05120 [Acidimicrobiaceae bacterium]|nr:hypothetical protein [Acidimicrobiaceae bacterium]
MTFGLLQSLRERSAFDPTPKFDDVGVYHVPFESMGAGTPVESRLRDGTLRGERIALIADSGCGKTSVVSNVLGPTAESVAPILVPVHSLEMGATKAELIADAILSQLLRQARAVGHRTPDAKNSVGQQRKVINVNRRTKSLGLGVQVPGWWARTEIAEQIEQQISTTEMIALVDKLDVIRLCLQSVRRDSLMPVFVFDDTDRWTVTAEDTIVEGFFGSAIRWLAEIDASVVVATHTRYLAANVGGPELLTFLDTRVELPRVPSVGHLSSILERRIQVHLDEEHGGEHSARLNDVVESSAIDELFQHYERGLSLRRVMQLAHIALAETVDAGAGKITGREIEAAIQA